MKTSYIKDFSLIFLFFCICSSSYAEEDLYKNIPEEKQKELKKENDEIWRFFSAGFLVNKYFDENISKAEIRNGIVRVTDSQNISMGIGLQAFFPFKVWSYVISNDNGNTWQKGSEISFGPYAGVMMNGDNIIDNFAIGFAYSQRREFGGIRLGVGFLFDPSVQRLADDFKDGESAPTGETSVKYKHVSTKGLQIMLSFTSGW